MLSWYSPAKKSNSEPLDSGIVIVDDDLSIDKESEIDIYNELLTITPTAYELISSKHSITDNYANQARELDISLEKFDGFANTLSGISKDSFDSKLLIDYLNE